MVSRGLGLRPVKSEKEEITWTNLSQDASTQVNIDIIAATNSPTTAGQIEIGDTVKSVYFEFHFSAETTTAAKVVHWTIQKLPAGVAAMQNVPSVYDSVVKRFILKRGMEMLVRDQATVFKRTFVVRIPPRIRRFGDGDRLVFSYIATSANTQNACGIAIYRHFG